MATVRMIHGFVGAGKTTFAKKLEQETGAVRFTLDERMIERHGANPPTDKFGEYEAETQGVLWEEAKAILNEGKDVILDYGFWKRADRDHYRAMAEELGADVKLYNIQCPEEEIRRRVVERTETMPDGAFYIDENALEEFRQRFEPIDPETETSILIETY